jgi:hypothetical protein
MNNIKIKNIIQTTIFILFISFIIWSRLLHKIEIKLITEYIFNIYIVSWSLVIFTYLIVIAFMQIIKYNISFKNTTGYFSILYLKFVEYFLQSYEPLLYYISIKIDLKRLIEYPVWNIVVYANYPQIYVLIFTKVPSIIMATIFFIEVLYLHKIDYFYKCLPLLLIPLIFNSCFFIIDEIALAQIEYVTPHMTCEYKDNSRIFGLAPESPNIKNALNLETMKKRLEWLTNQYLIFEDIKRFCDQIKDLKALYGPWFLLYTSTLYFISWLYIFISILHV